MDSYNTKSAIHFNNERAARKARDIVIDTLNNMDTQFYFHDAINKTISLLTVDDTTLTIPEGVGCFLVHEMLDVASVLVKALAVQIPKETFSFEFVGMDTYTEGWTEGKRKNGALIIKKTYFPDGYDKELDWDDYTTKEVIKNSLYSTNKTTGSSPNLAIMKSQKR